MNAPTARVLARVLGTAAEQRYGAPYWVIHRGDLQAVLIEAVRADPRISLELDARIDDYAVHGNGVTVAGLCGGRPLERHGIALIGADGLWSSVRRRLGHHDQPAFARHTAWRALVAADAVVADLRLPAVSLWLGRNAHLVHYPVQGGSLVNVVAIIRDDWREPGWHAPGDRRCWSDIRRAPGLPPREGARRRRSTGTNGRSTIAPRSHTGAKDRSRSWATPPIRCCPISRRAPPWRSRTPPSWRCGWRARRTTRRAPYYERHRLARTARAQREARRNGTVYHLGGARACCSPSRSPAWAESG